jgi:transposase
VAKVLEKTFGVRYSRDHVSYLLRKIGLSCQKPEEQATQRNEEAIKAWQNERWPALKKS